MHLETDRIHTSKSQSGLFDFLRDGRNYKGLMPDHAHVLEAEETTFKFVLKGMPEVSLALKEATPYTQVVYSATGGRISFDLKADTTTTAQDSLVQLSFDAQVSLMVKMMLKRPLHDFLEVLCARIGKL